LPRGIYGRYRVNHLGTYGRWVFLELQDPFDMEKQFGEWVEARVKDEKAAQGFTEYVFKVYYMKELGGGSTWDGK
jgi:hypothetical protein